jgi:hypothetical protein
VLEVHAQDGLLLKLLPVGAADVFDFAAAAGAGRARVEQNQDAAFFADDLARGGAELCAPQDCEINAAKRLLPRIRREHPQLPVLVTGDDLYAPVPFVKLCGECRMSYILVAQPSFHKELWEWVEELEKLGETQWVEWTEGPLAKRRYFRRRIARAVPLRGDDVVRAGEVEDGESTVQRAEERGAILGSTTRDTGRSA